MSVGQTGEKSVGYLVEQKAAMLAERTVGRLADYWVGWWVARMEWMLADLTVASKADWLASLSVGKKVESSGEN